MNAGLRLEGAMRYLLGFFLLAVMSLGAHADSPRTGTVEGGGGLPIAVTHNGSADAPRFVFVHGFLGSTLNWNKQLESELADEFHLTALDMRGHGASAKPWQAEHYLDMQLWADDIKAALESGGAGKPLMVAWSYGGHFVLDYVRYYGTDAIGGIVFVSSNAGFVPRPESPMTPVREQQIARSTSPNAATLLEWTEGYVDLISAGEELPPAEKQMLMVSPMMTPHYVRVFNREHRSDNSDLLEAVDVPVLFVIGGKDILANREQIESIAARLPQAQVSVFADSGNMPFWFDSAKFNRRIAEFATSLKDR
ncbi:MAG: alpha/beta hydrolase [Gammaproteobacteria bacterium]|nr:alpha/beta hydrolase [Gammaproteobacteria bacterium]